MDQHFDRLATTRGKTAQAPTCVFQHESGGQVWLSGLPTVATMQHWDKKGGIQLPGTQLLVVAPYPSHEEAEYTAPLAFVLAVSASCSAARTGKARLVGVGPASDEELGYGSFGYHPWVVTGGPGRSSSGAYEEAGSRCLQLRNENHPRLLCLCGTWPPLSPDSHYQVGLSAGARP